MLLQELVAKVRHRMKQRRAARLIKADVPPARAGAELSAESNPSETEQILQRAARREDDAARREK